MDRRDIVLLLGGGGGGVVIGEGGNIGQWE